jgi:cation diffusion facilitator family transporter
MDPSHGHGIDLAPGDGARFRAARRVTLIGLLLNVVLTSFKFVAGILGHSQAVLADGVHSLSDILTDLMVLIGARYWYRPADESHPYGHRRIETLVTTLLGVSLAGVGVGIGYRAIATYRDVHAVPPGWIAFAAAALSIVTKELIYRATIAVGRRIKSSALSANAWHHRSDALSSIPVAAAVAAAALEPSLAFLDRVGAAVVAVFILQAAWKIMAPALRQLVDAGAPREARERIVEIALATEGVRLIHAIRTRYVGSGLQVDLHVKVDPDIPVREGHRIAEDVTRRLLAEGPDVLDVVVHTEPYAGGDDASEPD